MTTEVYGGAYGVPGELKTAPRRNRGLIQRLGDFSTLSEALDYAARGESGFNFYSSRGILENILPYARLRELSIITAKRLLKLGLKRGDRVAVVADTNEEFLAVFFGCQYAGLVPCPMPHNIYLGGKDAYVERIAGMMDCARAALALAPKELAGHVSAAAEWARVGLVRTYSELAEVKQDRAKLAPFTAQETAYIQYSSGSTSEPKGVLITQQSITANALAILQHGLQARPGDRAFSWLPLYHDMGLVGFCIAPMMGQVSTDYLSTTAFARRPALWLKLMSDNKSTVTYSPTFGYQLAGRRINGDAAKLDLSALRVAGIGGDMVRPDVLEEFAARMKAAGFNSKAFLPSYGMAESTLAITFAELDQPVEVDVIDKMPFKHYGRAVPAGDKARRNPELVRSFVVCGKPLPGHDLMVTDNSGNPLADRQIGRILVRGPSLMGGYFGNEEATRAVMRPGGYLDTGDMGYTVAGKIVITGRTKELILHNGRNIWPQDIEWAAERIEPLRSGDVAA
ncbi:MAG TPA: fatty acyl-AMP ligase, partial [Aestuariivirgaceae bacterium]|nr:fatty acyl-AMP ligase [Aestuariivirgaceae bacterium]